MPCSSRSCRALAYAFLGLLFAAAQCGAAADRRTDWILEVEYANPRGGLIQLFYDNGHEWTQPDSISIAVPPSEALQPVRMQLHGAFIKRIRFDPALDDAPVRIGETRLLSAQGELLGRIAGDRWVPMNQVDRVGPDSRGGWRIHSVAGANDPMLLLDWPIHRRTFEHSGREAISSTLVVWLAALVFSLLIWTLGVALRGLLGDVSMKSVALPLGVFLIVLGGRVACLFIYSDPLPFWDEWDSEALYLLIPFQGNFLDLDALFIGQAEHRILFTRLVALGQVPLQGEWDPRVGMTAGAIAWAASCALLVCIGCSRSARTGAIVAASIVIWASLPFDAHNLFWGGQSQMYFLILLSVMVLSLALSRQVTGTTLAAASVASVLSLFTMGSGFIAPGLACGVTGYRLLTEPRDRRALASLAVTFAAAMGVGLSIYEKSHRHAPEYSRTWQEFIASVLHLVSFPWVALPLLALVVWIPVGACAIKILRRRNTSMICLAGMSLAMWAAIHVVAIGFARPTYIAHAGTRYFSVASMITAGAILCSVSLTDFTSAIRQRIISVLFLICAVAPMMWLCADGSKASRAFHAEKLAYNDSVRRYLTEPSAQNALRAGAIPYWNPAELAMRLNDAGLRRILPAAYRRVIAKSVGVADSAQVSSGWLTLAARTLMKLSWLLVATGFAAAVHGVWPRRANASAHPSSGKTTRDGA